MLDGWEREGPPFWLPDGSIECRAGKYQLELQATAWRQFDLFRDWLTRQFQALCPSQDADVLSMRLLTRTQGVAVMAHVYVYADPALIQREADGIVTRLEGLEPDG